MSKTLSFKTYSAKPGDVERKWYVVDAEGQILGRMAAEIAKVLRGKHKPEFTPHIDTGDFIVVTNAEKVALSGKKLDAKAYFSHSQYPGGVKFNHVKDLLRKKPEKVIEHAVWGMLPHNNLGRQLFKKLKVYPGATHPHESQSPIEMKVN
ncbi:50S ribosomal protein L13 [Chlorobium phaeovibrioides]|uniref:Large ribosomal subunit protein uL13 n=2 Tax=Chlorobium phaeovibrioides TaxID=1094 RepID=RL13_CHLPM|nr:50S ribosomal protein L13 [Chlorobium phaeovibrioides]A4SDB9.1 RecName: Full=Large ribosomal subunit protein uL13; AltName: Full=50S ribosomal protein L13 [Chlorobium phaeovibrioides DSM 265]HCD36841.1 50S ribosomal protein L13 [Chlorobium sp.]KAA6232115.1 50S ribosomal protein L13 [Chlorobium phaeovibrioides]MWV54418.1 50S ribosomal protein L13 [Chlorobium phaeovibrioides]QEQ57361.1 50S ribosomal protein L13 [Chlorobium phaeovibrioides]RTY34561.1 50S ribosomal protein L13 [Chlorobium phae